MSIGEKVARGIIGAVAASVTAKAVIQSGGRRNFWRKLRAARKRALRRIGGILVRTARALLGRKTKIASRPGEYPKSKTGNYRQSIKYEVGASYVRVGPSWPRGAHAGLLKYGTQKMRPRLVPAEGALARASGTIAKSFGNILAK